MRALLDRLLAKIRTLLHPTVTSRNRLAIRVSLGIAIGVLVAFASLAVYYSFLARQKVGGERIQQEIAGRFVIFGEKLVGRLPEFSWPELVEGAWPGEQIGGTWPGSGFISIQKYMEGRGFDASVINPLGDQDSIEKGQKLFVETCSACHSRDGKGGAHAPSLARPSYQVGASDFALYKVLRDGISGTPMNSFGLSIRERWQVVSFLRTLQIGSKKNELAENAGPPINVAWSDLLDAKSRPERWLTYSGSLDGWRHSRLQQITRANASGLKLLWAHQFQTSDDSSFAATPLMTNNTIFMSTPPSGVVALNATTGQEIWRFERTLPGNLPVCCQRVNRGLAILGGTLFVGTLDAKLIALDAKSGEVRWQTDVADTSAGYTITVAPLIAKDAVIIGVSGGEFGIRGFLSAYDASNGKMRWRLYTIPAPGEAGHESWKNDAWKTGGGPTWVTGSFDPDLNLLYWGVGNPSPNYAGETRPGDNLFSNSVVALDAGTGKLVWHFQFTPHDEHDWDSNQTPVLADIDIAGARRKVICWANRNGFYYVLDRTSGEFLVGRPFVEVTWASALDPNGRPVLTESAKVTPQGVVAKPWTGGGTNWLPPSFDPETETFFVHATEGSSIYTASRTEQVARGTNGIYVGSGSTVSEPAVNYVTALEAATGNIKWKYAAPRVEKDQSYTGVMSTSGGVVLSAADGIVFALDATSGKELWRAGLGGKVQATPISFELNGKQVIAITAGKTLFVFGL